MSGYINIADYKQWWRSKCTSHSALTTVVALAPQIKADEQPWVEAPSATQLNSLFSVSANPWYSAWNKTGFFCESSWETGQTSNFQEETKKLEYETGSAWSLPSALQSQAQSQPEKMRTGFTLICVTALGSREVRGRNPAGITKVTKSKPLENMQHPYMWHIG